MGPLATLQTEISLTGPTRQDVVLEAHVGSRSREDFCVTAARFVITPHFPTLVQGVPVQQAAPHPVKPWQLSKHHPTSAVNPFSGSFCRRQLLQL